MNYALQRIRDVCLHLFVQRRVCPFGKKRYGNKIGLTERKFVTRPCGAGSKNTKSSVKHLPWREIAPMVEEADIPETTESEIDQAIQQLHESALNLRAKDLIERHPDLRTYLRMISLLRQKNMTERHFHDMIFG